LPGEKGSQVTGHRSGRGEWQELVTHGNVDFLFVVQVRKTKSFTNLDGMKVEIIVEEFGKSFQSSQKALYFKVFLF
jgi:hypothetical protein